MISVSEDGAVFACDYPELTEGGGIKSHVSFKIGAYCTWHYEISLISTSGTFAEPA
jgi:hypothetical protein